MHLHKDPPWWTRLYALLLIASVAIGPNVCEIMPEAMAEHAWVVYLTLMHAGAAALCNDIARRTHVANNFGTFWFASKALDEITMGNIWGQNPAQWYFLGTMMVMSLVWQLWDILRKR